MGKTLLGSVLNRVETSDLFGKTSHSLFQDEPKMKDLQAMDQISTVFTIVDGISSGVADGADSMKLYRGDGPTLEDDPDAELVDGPHPAKSLWDRPNGFYDRGEFVEAMQQHYELTGEYWWVLSRGATLRGRQVRSPFPLEMWVVRPDRIRPVPDPRAFIAGYAYKTGGVEIALDLDDVIFAKRQNPMDPYRGMSALGSLILDLEGEKAAAAYNTMFFKNGARPDAIISDTEDLSDPQFDRMLAQFNSQHQGVANSHRVGILEKGKFTPIAYTRKDMEFLALREFSKETIREAWRFPRSMMGSEAASNRATHEAERLVFAENLIKPRLKKLRASLNRDLLPMFGSMGEGYFFDYDDPSPDDHEREREDMKVGVDAALKLIEIGADVNETFEAFGLPMIHFPNGVQQRPRIELTPSQNVEDNGNGDGSTVTDDDE